MKEIILCKYGEIVLKGANRGQFETALVKDMKYRLQAYGSFSVRNVQSTMTIEPLDDFADLDGAFEAACRVFGIAGVVRAAVAEKNMDSILETVKAYIPQFLVGKKTFKVEAKRSDKAFPLSSPEISAQAGAAVLSSCPRMRVNVREPDITVKVEAPLLANPYQCC